ncbi:MAG TPA: hypothetical protein VFW44_03470 [Bryobacteraceae bacterium]|nr:hypothetical protein [Bryobacteraceae bacterium]
MAKRSKKRVFKGAKKATPKTRVAKKSRAKKPAAKKPARAAATTKPAKAPRVFSVDLSGFPVESIAASERWLCVACVWQIFTQAMKLAPKTALAEMKRYTPSFEELSAAEAARPFFAGGDKQPCPYCGSPAKWHARIETHRIESGKATDALRRNLVKSLPTSKDQFVVLEQKATQQHAFFEWLEKIGAVLDLDDPAWLRDVSLHYLGRKEPKVNWQAEFEGVHSIRRSRRLGLEPASQSRLWETDHGRLFLAPMLFDELLLVQYLVSRAQLAGGLTLERRYTLPELWHRLRHSGYLRSIGVQATNPSDALEQILAHLSGGEASARYYYIVDRRDLLEKVKALETEKPRARAAGR